VLCLLLVATAFAVDQQILFVGNSYTAANGLHDLVQLQLEAGELWSPIQAEAVTRGGHTLSRHLADAENPAHPLYTYLQGGAYSWHTVVLQDQSQIPGFPEYVPDRAASNGAVGELDALIDANGASTMLFLTWGRRDGDAFNPGLFPDYSTMQDLLTQGYRDYHAIIDAPDRRAFIAPAGEAFRIVHEDVLAGGGDPSDPSSEFHRLYSADGSHPSAYGSFLVSAVFHAALTGRTPVGLGVLEADVDDEAFRAYLEGVAARAVVDAPFDFPYPWAWELSEVQDGQVSDPGRYDLVRVAESHPDLPELTVGADHAGEPGAARLWVTTDGALHVDALTLGAEGGSGEVLVDAGRLSADQLIVGTGRGDLVVTGGELRVGEASLAGEGSLMMESGYVAVDAGRLGSVTQSGGTLTGAFTVEGDLEQLEGTLSFGDRNWVDVRGVASLMGTVDVTAVTAYDMVVLTADSLLADTVRVAMRVDQEVAVDSVAGTISVFLAKPDTTGTTKPTDTGMGGAGTGSGGTGAGGTSTGSTTDADTGAAAAGKGGTGGCGCATGRSPGWLSSIAWIVTRR
jgi:hypothetical protein